MTESKHTTRHNTSATNGFIIPDVLRTGKLDTKTYPPEKAGTEEAQKKACSDALIGWAGCISGLVEVNDNFGKGLIKLKQWAGIPVSMTGDSLIAYVKKKWPETLTGE